MEMSKKSKLKEGFVRCYREYIVIPEVDKTAGVKNECVNKEKGYTDWHMEKKT